MGSRNDALPWLEVRIRHRQGALSLNVQASLTKAIAVVVGPSGSGKTSLLRSVAGLLQPREGRIAVAGTTVWDRERRLALPAAARGCGFVMQRPTLFPSMSAADNIAFGLHRLEKAERQRRVEEMIALFQIASFARQRPASLSGGEQQRVALARSLAPRPRVLLLDEPFAGLDERLKDDILTDFERWRNLTATPVLHVTHDIAEAWRLGSHPGAEVLRMEGGAIVKQGSAAEILAEERGRLLQALR